VTLELCTQRTVAMNPDIFGRLLLSCGATLLPSADCCAQVRAGLCFGRGCDAHLDKCVMRTVYA